MKDYGEPIRYACQSSCHGSFNEDVLLDRHGHVIQGIWGDEEERLTRIAECTNACKGIEDPGRVIPLLVEAVRANLLYWQRDSQRSTAEQAIQDAVNAIIPAFSALQPKEPS